MLHAFQYQDSGRLIMKGCVPFKVAHDFGPQLESNLDG